MLITISRQYAAGSSHVAARVAEALGWSVVDNEFVEQVAERAHMAPEDVAAWEERVPSFVERFARSTALSSPELFMPVTPELGEYTEARIVKVTKGLVSELAHQGRMVLVGRAAVAVLAHEADMIHARLVAPVSFRVQRAIDELGIPAKEAARTVDDRDRNRNRYVKEYFGFEWADASNYHMTLNTEALGFDGAADLILARARGLGWS